MTPAELEEEVERVVALAVLAERERCAKMAESGAEADPHNHAYEFGYALAAAIRAGGQP